MGWTPKEELEQREKYRPSGGDGTGFVADARRSGTFLIEGDGLRAKVAIGAPDLEHEVQLEIQNRFIPQGQPVYTRVTRIQAGMVLLDQRPLREHDQVYVGQSGLTIGMGALPEGSVLPPGRVDEIGDAEGAPYTYAWKIVGSGGRVAVLTIGMPISSQEIADLITPRMRGEFHVERIDAGSMQAAENFAVPGWRTVLIRHPAPASEPSAEPPSGPRR